MADDDVGIVRRRPKVPASLFPPKQEATMDAVTGAPPAAAASPLNPAIPKLDILIPPPKPAAPATPGNHDTLKAVGAGVASILPTASLQAGVESFRNSMSKGDQSEPLLQRIGGAIPGAIGSAYKASLLGKAFGGVQALGEGAGQLAEGVQQAGSTSQAELKTPFSGQRRPVQPQQPQPQQVQQPSPLLPEMNHYPVPQEPVAATAAPSLLKPAVPPDRMASTPSLQPDFSNALGRTVDTPALSAAQQRAAAGYTNSIKAGWGTPAERAAKQDRMQYDVFGKPVADDAAARQMGEIAAQGEANRAVQAEKTKGELAGAESARTYRQTENDQRNAERRYEIEERGRVQAESKKDLAIEKSQNESARRNDVMFKEAEAMVEKQEGLAALSKMVDISHAAASDKNLDPNIKEYYVMRANTVAQEQARAMAPKLTGEKLVSLRNALLKFKGDVNAPEIQSLIASGKA